MSEYTITARSEGLLGQIGRWGAALIDDEELLEALAAHDAEVRAGVVAEEPAWPDWTEEQVQAALDAWYGSGHHRAAVGMRSALNAACGAWEQVES